MAITNYSYFVEDNMRVAVVGSNGRTGKQVVSQALTRGHEVIAVARRPNTVAGLNPGLTCIAGDVLDQGSIIRALAGAEAVVSALGVGTTRSPTVVYSQGTANILKAMDEHSARKLAVISAAPVAVRTEQPFFQRLIILPILERVFGATYDDMRRMESVLDDSGLDWTCLRPPRLLDKPQNGSYRLDTNRPLAKARNITHADVASALLDCLDREDLYRRTVSIAN